MPELTTSTKVRIFISSPGDVMDARDALEDVIVNKLQPTIGNQLGLHLQPMRWEGMVAPGMGDIQKNVFEEMGEYDIFVGIFWKRFGTPTPEYGSGSEAEFWDAYRRWEEDNSRPILMYFCETPFLPTADDLEQYAKVLKFKEEIGGKGLYSTYDKLEQFKGDIQKHLFKRIQGLVAGKEPFKPSQSGSPTPTPALRDRYLRNLRRDCLRIPLSTLGDDIDGSRPVALDQVFVSLEVIERDHEKLRQAPEEALSEEGNRLTALDALENATYSVLLGAPGAGKSSLVKHMLANMAAHEMGQEPPLLKGTQGLLPVLVVLRDLAPRLSKAVLPARGLKREKALAEAVLAQAMLTTEDYGIPDFATGVKHAFEDEQVFLVLDGLDEVPYDVRPLVREATAAVLSMYNLSRVIVTCRIRSYTGEAVFKGVHTYTLAPLDEERITLFINNWYQAQCNLGRVLEKEQQTRVQDLIQVATQRPLVSLAANPMLLTTMTIIHQKKTRLPDERVRLYKEAVELLLKRWQEDHAGLPDHLADFIASEDRVRPAMEKLAFQAHKAGKDDNAADIERDEALQILMEPQHLQDEVKAIQFLDYVDLRSGLLVGRGGSPNRPHVYSFPHRTFQEYLAGCFIVGARGAASRIQQLADEGDFWSEAVLLGIEEQVYNSGSYGRNQILNLASRLTQKPPKTEGESRRTLWAARMADVVGADIVSQDPGDVESGKDLLMRLKEQAVGLLSGALPAVERAEAGRTLATLGDPRGAVSTLEGMRFSFVPKGPFVMGDDRVQVDVPYDYWMGVYPVTQAQFQYFVDARGYEQEQWWSKAGWTYITSEGRNEPKRYTNSIYQLPNHPVVGVTWYEAQAFTQWLTNYGHKQEWFDKQVRIMLPNDPEWEKAARGGLHIPVQPTITTLNGLHASFDSEEKQNPNAGRKYPWGDTFNAQCCNSEDTGIGVTSCPGCFGQIESAYEVEDLSGNVWEWCRSKGEAEYIKGGDWSNWEAPDGEMRRVVRGGSFGSSVYSVRCARRYWFNPFLSDGWGFRVVALPR